jgi:diguanylate cyclase (GGDEF)-like protein
VSPTMRVIISRALLPIAGYWSLLLALSIHVHHFETGDADKFLPFVVLLGLPVVVLASIILFRDAHASGSQLALRDDLTGVGNRRAFVAHSQTLIRNAQPGDLGLVLLDVDGLKALNDECGHQAGDELLEKLTRRIEMSESLYRIGGDEFAILVDRRGSHDSVALMQNLEPFVAAFESCGHMHEVRVSFGATSNREGEKFEDLFRRADDSLIQQKRRLYRKGWMSDRRGDLQQPPAAPATTKELGPAGEASPSSLERRLKLLG